MVYEAVEKGASYLTYVPGGTENEAPYLIGARWEMLPDSKRSMRPDWLDRSDHQMSRNPARNHQLARQ
jgi:hypothetical protein